MSRCLYVGSEELFDAVRATPMLSEQDNRALYAALGSTDKTVRIYPGLRHEIFNEPEHAEVIDDLMAWLAAHPAG